VDSIGPYEIISELGRGGMGVVLRARDTRTGAEVALKLMHSAREASPRALQRVAIEQATLARLRHPHVVSVLDTGEHEGAPYLALELVAGESLEDRLRRGPLSIEAATRLGLELADALVHVHGQGVLHRDLKPDNILLRSADGAALLTDFGLALDLEASYSRISKTGVFMGSPGYWAPEQAQGEVHSLSPATDVYGLGAVLYAALTARPPVAGTTLLQFIAAARRDQVVPVQDLRPEVPAWLATVCSRCLRLSPEERFPTAADLERALREQRSQPGPRRARALLALGATALVLAGAAAAARPDEPATPPGTPPAAPPAGHSSTPRPEPSEPNLLEQALEAQQAGRSKEASSLFRRSADAGNVEAMVRLGHMLENGHGVDRDDLAAAALFRRAAKAGDLEGINSLGEMYEDGRGVPQDHEEAVEWYQRAANRDDPQGLRNLANMTSNGRGVAEDKAEARRLYRRAANAGDARSMVNLGSMLLGGRGGAKDAQQGVRWIRRGVAKGEPRGMLRLGLLLESGTEVAQDKAEAVRLYRRALEKGGRSTREQARVALERLDQ
jgi:TPR repeat protein